MTLIKVVNLIQSIRFGPGPPRLGQKSLQGRKAHKSPVSQSQSMNFLYKHDKYFIKPSI